MCADKREAEVLVKINQLAPASIGQCVQQRHVADDNSESDSSDSESEQVCYFLITQNYVPSDL